MHKFALIYSAIGECYVGLVQHLRKMSFKEAVEYFGEKCEKPAAKMAAIFKAMGETIVEIAANAQNVKAGDFGSSAIVVTGGFETIRGPWTFGKNFLQIIFKVGDIIKTGLKAITPRVISESILPTITSVYDVGRALYNKVKPGDTIQVAGDDLAPDTDTEDEGIWLRRIFGAGTLGQEYQCEITSSELQLVKFTCPADITPGAYMLCVRTRCGLGSAVALKTVEKLVQRDDVD